VTPFVGCLHSSGEDRLSTGTWLANGGVPSLLCRHARSAAPPIPSSSCGSITRNCCARGERPVTGRWKWIVSCLLATLFVALTVALWPPPASRLTKGLYSRIDFGMTPAEVASIIGGPPLQNPRPDLLDGTDEVAYDRQSESCSTTESWADKGVIISVGYNHQGVKFKTLNVPASRWRWWRAWLRQLIGL
jgi:hypothetical protein